MNKRSYAVLILLSVIAAYAAYQYGGVTRFERYIFLAAIGVLGSIYWLFAGRFEAPPIDGPAKWALVVFAFYPIVQMAPLPLAVLRMVSPTRAELAESVQLLEPAFHSAPLSVAPSATMNQFLLICGYITVFLLVRELAARFSENPWILAAPLIVVTAAEAVLCLTQAFSGQDSGEGRGTYANRDHLANLLAMVLPLAVVWGLAILRRTDPRHSTSVPAALKAAFLFAASALILLGIVYSLSRMGFISALASLFLMGTVAWSAGASFRRKLAVIVVIVALVGLGFLFLPPDQLISRFADLTSTEGLQSQDRIPLWSETLRLFRAYPLFGCGLGGFESAFMRYKVTAPLVSDDYAHNDYLQLLTEAGICGALIMLGLLCRLLFRITRCLGTDREPEKRLFALGCFGSLIAVFIHSFVDFNLHTPANAILLVWILAMGYTVSSMTRPLSPWKAVGLPEFVEIA